MRIVALALPVAVLAGCAAAPLDLAPALEPVRAESGLPALAAIVVVEGEVVALGAAGDRGVEQAWHVGSIGKSLTALVAARLVERGALRWDTTLAAGLPELAATIHPGYRDATLRQLLDHRAGLAEDHRAGRLADVLWRAGGDVREQRAAVASSALALAPAYVPGAGRLYANRGYVVAGAMIERAEGATWEAVTRRELFEPLALEGSGFGPPPDFAPTSPFDALPAWYGPSGDVHVTLRDFAKLADVLLGRAPSYLADETLEAMQRPRGAEPYACGLSLAEADWASGPVLGHDGRGARWYASWIGSPADGVAALVVCDDGGEAAAEACRTWCRRLAQLAVRRELAAALR